MILVIKIYFVLLLVDSTMNGSIAAVYFYCHQWRVIKHTYLLSKLTMKLLKVASVNFLFSLKYKFVSFKSWTLTIVNMVKHFYFW